MNLNAQSLQVTKGLLERRQQKNYFKMKLFKTIKNPY